MTAEGNIRKTDLIGKRVVFDSNIKARLFVERVAGIFMIIYMLGYVLYRMVYASSLILLSYQASLVICGVIGLFLMVADRRYALVAYVLFAILCYVLCFMAKYGDWYYPVPGFIQTLSHMGCAYWLIAHRPCAFPYRVMYYMVAAFILFQVLVRHVSIRNIMKVDNTYNYISVFALFYLGMFCITKLMHDKKVSILNILVFLVICVLAYGRGGIVTGLVFTALALFLEIKGRTDNKLTLLLVLLALVLLVIFGQNIIESLLTGGLFAKFQKVGLTTQRTVLWSNFIIESLESIKNFLFGVNATHIRFDGNVHNAYLQMYASMGFGFAVVNYLFIIAATVFNLKNRQYWLTAVVMVIFMRAFLDKTMYPGSFEVFLYYYIFNYIVANEQRRIV